MSCVLAPAMVVAGEVLFENGVGVGDGELLGDPVGVGEGDGVGEGEPDGVGEGEGKLKMPTEGAPLFAT